MDFQIPSDFMTAKEAEVVPKGMYPLVVEDAEVGESNTSGLVQLSLRFSIEGYDNAKPIYLYLQAPGQDGLKNPSWTALQLKRFIIAFNIPYAPGMTFAEIAQASLGARAMVNLSVEHDDKYGAKNIIQLPQLKE